MEITYDLIKKQAKEAMSQLVEISKAKQGDIAIIGCSSSEIKGFHIGKGSDDDVAKAVYEGVREVLEPKGIFLAAQCCEHLNRAVITEKEALPVGAEIVNVVPQIHAGGSFAVNCYKNFKNPVAVECLKCDLGMDIGDTLIGMHLKSVAVPVRLSLKEIGNAHLTCARTRPKFIGGSRAVYDEKLSGGDIPR